MDAAAGVPDTAPDRLSATVMLVRDAPGGLEVFMVRRSDRSSWASAYVFPGGTVHADDVHEPWLANGAGARLAAALNERAGGVFDPATAGSIYTCAVRELFEEAGVLLAHDRDGATPRVDPSDTALQERLLETRRKLQDGTLTLAEALTADGLVPDYDAVVPFSHWVTPIARPQRYDTWFFVAAMPDGQEALHCAVETVDGEWLTPAAALRGAEAGTHLIVFPTQSHLRRILPFQTVAGLLAFARTKPIPRVQPVVREGEPNPWLPPDLVDAW